MLRLLYYHSIPPNGYKEMYEDVHFRNYVIFNRNRSKHPGKK